MIEKVRENYGENTMSDASAAEMPSKGIKQINWVSERC